MSLAALNWKYVGSQGFAAGTVDAALAALYTLGTAVTYADATTRTEGSGSAWTYTGNRYQNAGVNEALYPVSPTNTLNMRCLIAGQATGGVKTPTMGSPDTAATVTIMASISKNSGAWTTWDAALPFTSGSSSGLFRVWPGAAGAGTVYLFESQEAAVIMFSTTAGGMYGLIMGAWIDPESPDTTLDAESDGKLYGVCMSNITTVMNVAWWSMGSVSDWLKDTATLSQCHNRIFTPGAGTMIGLAPLLTPRVAMTANAMKSRSGRWGRQAIALRATAAAANDQTIGRAREMYLFAPVQMPAKQSNAGVTIGHCVSASSGATADAILLLV